MRIKSEIYINIKIYNTFYYICEHFQYITIHLFVYCKNKKNIQRNRTEI